MPVGRFHLRRRWAIFAVALLALAAVLGQASCATTIVPPEEVEDPVRVHVIDYGRHSSLVLPGEEGALIEYAYGEYRWFAEGESQWYRVPAVMLFPTEGTLGRLEVTPPRADIDRIARGARYLSFDVDAARAAALRSELDEQFEAGGESIVNPAMGALEFVTHPDRYSLFYNCNHATAAWLRELDCRIVGWPVLSNFRLREQD